MDYKNILLERRDNIAVLSLNRPNKLNAFTFPMMEEMIDALDVLDADDNIHALIITGKGRAFCAGADLSSGQETFNPSFDDFAGRIDGDRSFQQSLDRFSELFLTTSQARLAVVGCAAGVVAVPQLLRRELSDAIPRHEIRQQPPLKGRSRHALH